MLRPRDIYNQLTSLTGALIESGFCDAQNFPSIIDCPHNITDIGVSGKDYSFFLKSITYAEMYQAALEKKYITLRYLTIC